MVTVVMIQWITILNQFKVQSVLGSSFPKLSITFQCEWFLSTEVKFQSNFMSFSAVGSRDTSVSDTSVFRVLWLAAVCHLCFSLPSQVSWSPVYWRLEFPTVNGDRKPVIWTLNQFPFWSSKARFWPCCKWKLVETLHTEMQLNGILGVGSMACANPAGLAGDVVAPECVPCFLPQQISSSDAFSSVSVNSC